MSTANPLPDEDTVDGFIAANLDLDTDDDRSDWTRTILGEPHSRVVGRITPDRCMTLRMTHEFAHRVSSVAAEQGLTRSAYIRRAVTRQVERDLGLPEGSMDGGMLPRTGYRQ